MAVLRIIAVIAAAALGACTNSVDIPCSSSGQCPNGSFCNSDGLCEQGGGEGVVQTVVGGAVGDDGPAEQSILRDVSALAVDDDGTIYVGEFQHGRIRRIDPDGTISTFVGTGLASSGGSLPSDGRAVRVGPRGLALDADYLYYTDDFVDTVRRVDKITGTVEAVGITNEPRGIAIDPDTGLIYVADPSENRVFRFDPMTGSRVTFVNSLGSSGSAGDGGSAGNATLTEPYGVAINAGVLYISDTDRVRQVDLGSGTISLAAGGRSGSGGDGGAPTAAGLNEPRHLAIDGSGNLLIADTGNNRVRIVDFGADVIDTFAGGLDCCFIAQGVAPTDTFLPQPEAVAVAPDASVLIGDNRNNLLRRVSGGSIETIAGGASPVGDSGTDARINRPFGVEPDGEGGFYVVDPEASSVWQVSAGGTVSLLAGSGVRGFGGDGELATSALLDFPEDVAVDADGNVYISDTGNDRVRRVDRATGIISTFAGGGTGADGGPANLSSLSAPAAIEFHPDDGRMFIAERDAHLIRVVESFGARNISTIAGTGERGTDEFQIDDPLLARMNEPNGLAFDRRGYLYISERGGHVVRRLRESEGLVDTLIGQPGVSSFCGDKSDARQACLDSPHHLAVDLTTDTLYIADTDNHRIRKYVIVDGEIDSATGGGLGEGGTIESATGAELAAPIGLSAIPGGGLLIGNSGLGQVKAFSE